MRTTAPFHVSDVTRRSGVSIRTLHHYEAIGLLQPSARSDAGYRLYDARDLLRLQQILLRRALGMPLEEIRRSLDEPSFDYRSSLRAQREALPGSVVAGHGRRGVV